MIDKLKQCKTFSEAAKLLLGVKYYNGNVKKVLEKKCFDEYKIDINELIQENNKKYCLFCGKEISKNKKFCNNSCSASFNNKNRTVTEEQKVKTSISLLKYHENLCEPNKNFGRNRYKHICPICSCEFYGKKEQTYCSRQCSNNSPEKNDKISEKAKKRIKDGTFSGWKTRGKNVQSYPEKFWEKVLQNNKIPYEREKHVGKYFLDFVIQKNGKFVDLEIDGKQHQIQEIKNKDLERDNFLKNEGYLIYRIDWNNINQLSGKQKMQDKINDFIDFINSIN